MLGAILPAQYYSTPPGDRRPLVGKGVPWGCGIASIVFLMLLFAGGYMGAHGGMQRFIGYVIDNSMTDVDRLLTKDVSPELRKTLDTEMHNAAYNVRVGRASIESCSPLLQTLRDTTSDRNVNAADVEKLLHDLRAINGEKKK